MKPDFFSSLLPELSNRAARSTVGILGFSNRPLRRHLLSLFSQGYGEQGSFVATPVFEATYSWKTAGVTLAQLSGKLLHPAVVSALDKPWGESSQDYRLPAQAQPYTHQLMAWQALLGPGCQSVVVTSGTGSGKTECFMVPVLSSIAQSKGDKAAISAESSGIQALFLYPLNALIQSQRERLRAWTGPFDGGIRFCLYNGNTPDKAKADEYRKAPNEVHDRTVLRDCPPDILVTNPTMLEYMLVRAQDAPILEKSQGKLRWIVLDEAHNYIGSQAAELALLLRRVLHAFGTSASQVRFVATSATIGAADAVGQQQLQEFLSRLAGVAADKVTVVTGERAIPPMQVQIEAQAAQQTQEQLRPGVDGVGAVTDSHGLYQRLVLHPVARKIRSLFIPAEGGQSFQTLSAVQAAIATPGGAVSEVQALQWLDTLTAAVSGDGRDALPFLPLRLHAFHNTLNGLWACANPDCQAKRGSALDDPQWSFGAVYTAERSHCTCGAPVFPLVSCNDCNQTYLKAHLVSSGTVQKLQVPVEDAPDEFTLEREPEDAPDDEAHEPTELMADWSPMLIVNGNTASAPLLVHQRTLEIARELSEETIALRVQDISIIDDQQVLQCPECNGHAPGFQQFRVPRLGAPFQLGNIIPTLLEFCPDGELPLNMPRRGRRMITFTDSRQGTARMAAKLQQDAERNALRSAVYRKVVSGGTAATGEKEQLQSTIDQFRAHLPPEGSPLRPLILAQIQEKEDQLQSLQAGKAVNHDDMVAWLATQSADISRWIHGYYAESDVVFKGSKGAEILARILLCREFGRRPKYPNNLETMGLVRIQYPKLALVASRRPAVEMAGFTLDEWRSFLKIALDFFVRESRAVQLPGSWDRWGAERIFSKQLLPPASLEKTTRKQIKWPRVRKTSRQSRLVRLLAYALQLDPSLETSRDRIDALLLAAWEDLTLTTNLLQAGADQGRYLDMADMAFQPLTQGWICPVTRRVLDVTLRNITPYLPEKPGHEGVARCQPVTIPVCDVLTQDFPHDDARVAATRAWVQAHPVLQGAIEEGIWSNLNDRVVEGAGYFRAVEHSAQQSGKRLEHYEDLFKRGQINLMSCTTTMEMGVDIGGINMVAMNNVPPHPANYLQRAGRAGRRAETRSVALTVCKNNPHDQHVFHNPTWPFTTQVRTPGISLSSPLIVQRHINSMLLAHFLRLQSKEGKLNTLVLDWWMLPRGESRQERFVAWCDCFDAAKHPDLRAGLVALIARTVFEGRNVAALVAEAGRNVAAHASQWLKELDAINVQIAQLSAKDADDQLPMRALQVQAKRLQGEYLLRELATSGVLPGYGFPTDITTFETLNKDSWEIQRQRDSLQPGREDNKFQRRELPSRDTVTALREYAPGASVVIDGLVYQSAGITLNWHAPATLEQVSELQNIRQAWRCGHCGTSGTFVLAQRLEQCPECGNTLQATKQNMLQYLEPAGFSVDIAAETHNDITLQEYVPVERPWITAQGDWIPLPNPGAGRFRSTPLGSVFHHSSGVRRSGYALCLECGRTAAMGNDEDPEHGSPTVFSKPHKRLRGGKLDGRWECDGSHNDFKIKQGIHFGREYTTDVLELVLQGIDGQPLSDATVGFTLAVALRRAIAEKLGVEESELGCDTKMLRDDWQRTARAIQVFDVRSAGYSSLVAPDLSQLLRTTRSVLQCPANCKGACQMCLLTFDTRFRVADLDRQKALDFLSNEWLDALALESHNQLMGPASQAEFQTLQEAIAREINRGDARHLYVYLHGSPEEWDLPGSALRHFLHRLSARDDIHVTLLAATAEVQALSRENASLLQSLESLGSISLCRGTTPLAGAQGWCLATVERADKTCISWATADPVCASCGPQWGQLSDGIVVWAPTSNPVMKGEPLRLPTFAELGVQSVAITSQLDGPGSGFGARFWQAFGASGLSSLLASNLELQSVAYEDRYLATPLSCALLLEVISALKAHCDIATDAGWNDAKVQVTTMWIDEPRILRRQGHHWSADWEHAEQRDRALEAAFAYCGMDASVRSAPKHELIHGRRLVLRFQGDSCLTLWLDQGLSYWTTAKRHRHTPLALLDMSLPPAHLGEQLAQLRIDVQGHELATQIFVDCKHLQ